MKKTLTILIAFVAILLTSCVKSNNNVTPNRTVFLEVRPSHWVIKNNGTRYTASYNVPEIDDYVHDSGAVLVYAEFDQGIWEQIPEVYQGIAYSYSYIRGGIDIDIENSNGTSIITPPGRTFRVKVVLIDSDY